MPRVRTQRLGNRSFGYSAPAACNSLPKDLHASSISSLSFKSMLKTHVFCSYSLTVVERRALLSLHLNLVAQYKFFVIIIMIIIMCK